MANWLSTILSGLLLIFLCVAPPLVRHKDQAKPLYRQTGSEATITGVVSFFGNKPQRKRIDTSSDAICDQLSPPLYVEDVLVRNGKLANVVVYLKGEPIDSFSFEAPTATAVLTHTKCRYEPHVLGIREGQALAIANKDATHHNTRPYTRLNADWNRTQAPGAEPYLVHFKRAELFIRFNDNQHPWESAYLGVFSHPFFAVSQRDGSYRISGVPPGHYTLGAWHERFGEQSTEISITSNEMKKLDLSFESSAK
jgi:hypothetical protein